MNDINKTNADECLDELFSHQPENKNPNCECDSDCSCGENCECTPDNKCADNCDCSDTNSNSERKEADKKNQTELNNDSCDCSNDEKCEKDSCDCGENCSCSDECNCTPDDKCNADCKCGEDSHSNSEKCHCGCGEELDDDEKTEQPSDSTFESLLRLQAEFDNYRKRTEKEKSSIYQNGFIDAVTDFLPALDSFKMAKEYITDKNTLVGVEYIEQGILSTLEKMGVTPIDASGKFDPNFHQAIDTSNEEGYESGDIVKECYKGFKIGDKVIRFSQVIVKK